MANPNSPRIRRMRLAGQPAAGDPLAESMVEYVDNPEVNSTPEVIAATKGKRAGKKAAKVAAKKTKAKKN